MLLLSNLYPYLMLMGSVADVFLLGKGFFSCIKHPLFNSNVFAAAYR